jgi:hypothetical protein
MDSYNRDLTWKDLMDLIDISSSVKADLLNEEIKLSECIKNQNNYKRTFNEMMKEDENQLSQNKNIQVRKKIKIR